MKKGFTLIELLVVVAIIGILATIVISSLGSARDKSKEAAVKSTLRNMMAQAELSYSATNNYSTACASVQNLIDAINDGATSSCYSHNYAPYSDVYRRWGSSAIMDTSTPIRAHSAGPNGVVTWDTQGVNSSGVFVSSDVGLNWTVANAACITAGGRLPTMEELKSLSNAVYIASATYTPPSFASTRYWSSTVVPSSGTSHYSVDTSNGTSLGYPITSNLTVRCVR